MTTSPYQQHSETSRQAAEAIDMTAPTLRMAVLRAIVQAGQRGLTDECHTENLEYPLASVG